MSAVLQLGTFKYFLGITGSDTARDVALNLVLEGVWQSIETWIGRGPLGAMTATEYYSPGGEQRLSLDRFPLATPDDVTEVAEDWNGNWGQTDGSFDTASVLELGTGYAVETEGVSKRAVLVRIGGVWPYSSRYPPGRLSSLISPSSGTVRVTYKAGWTEAAPADVIAAAYAEAAALWASRRTGYGLQTSAGLDGYNIAITPFNSASQRLGSSPFVTERLLKAASQYRRVPIGR